MSAVDRGRGGSFSLSGLFASSAVGLAMIASAGSAHAQAAPAAAPSDPAATSLSEIVVTGSRIRSGGFTAPTPTQALGQADLERNAEPNVFTTIAQLPSLQ